MKEENYYQILDISEDASPEEIKKAYRNLARKYHPDINKESQTDEMFKKINNAYKVLSDHSKRVSYDKILTSTTIRSEEETIETAEEKQSKFWLFSTAFVRVAVIILGAAFLGSLLEFLVWYIVGGQIFAIRFLLGGIVFGALAGTIWGIDINFDIESFLEIGYAGKIYSFSRTILAAVSIGYFGGLFGFLLDKLIYKEVSFLTIFGFIFGILIGSTLGSDGETFFKIKSKAGRVKLLRITLRGATIGLLGALIAFFIALTMHKFSGLDIVKPALFFGFVLGSIFGSVNPENLSFRASYPSARLKSIIVTFIILSLFAGIIIILFKDLLLKLLNNL
jgi:curved DNA-binding protein CbpA